MEYRQCRRAARLARSSVRADVQRINHGRETDTDAESAPASCGGAAKTMRPVGGGKAHREKYNRMRRPETNRKYATAHPLSLFKRENPKIRLCQILSSTVENNTISNV